MTDYRALCARMADELDYYRQLLMDDRREVHALATEARAALVAEPEPEGLTDQELLEVLDRATADFPPNHPEAEPMTGARYALTLELRKARAAIAADRARRPAPEPPADGEVAELVEWLEQEAVEWAELGEVDENARLHRAAELLAQRYPQPPGDGEVAELVNHARSSNTQAVALAVALEQLADAADEYGPAGGADGKALSEAVKRARKTLNRAADLLEQRHPAPVPVSERPWERKGWCDAKGFC